MNIYQKSFSRAAKENIKLFPLWENGSFYKRRKLFRVAWKLKIDPFYESDELLDEDLADTKSVLDEPLEMDCLGCDYSTFKVKCPDCCRDWDNE